MPGAELTIPALLKTRRRADAALQAVLSQSAAVTYAELDDASRALAARLVGAGAAAGADGVVGAGAAAGADGVVGAGAGAGRGAGVGVGKGSRVGLLMPNGVDWAVAALAVMRVGAVLVPLSTLLRPPELLEQLRSAAVTHLIAVTEFRGRRYLEELGAPGASVPSLRRIWAWDALPPDPVPPDPVPADVVEGLEGAVRPADDLVILFTSGSRGRPKGVIHTHGGALRATASGLDARRVGPGERLYLPMPFFWSGGFGGGLLSSLLAGATLLTEAIPEPTRTLRFLEKEQATLFRGWPDQAARLAADPDFATTDLSRLGPASLGAVLPAERRPAPGARANLFGMTETMGPYCGFRLDVDLPAGKRGSCGRPFVGVEVRVTEPDHGFPTAPGAIGEIRLRGPNLMRGIRGRTRAELFDADGFYPTGDLGVLDADGYLWYHGRLDDMVKVKGATVYPTEVEAALRGLPGVRGAYVTDVADDAGARQVAALVVVDPHTDAGDLGAKARTRLSSFKVPTRWLVAEETRVPRLASGKVDTAALRRLLESAPTEAIENI